ncbi:MAG: DUF2851 family protein [Chitinophagales bacterium]|nr:DUF2851 family protein [Chitinophagales bacterium]
MREQFLHFIWQSHRFNHNNLQSTQGQSITIIDYGKANLNDGPDFLFAKVLIGEVLWVGHVEIHTNSSDWDKHKHSDDNNYKNVILHVVYIDDKPLQSLSIPTLELQGLIPKSTYNRYMHLMESTAVLPCHHLISEIEENVIEMYFQRLAIERLESKVSKIETLLEKFQFDFEQVAFIWLSRYFGTGANSDAFEQLASTISSSWLSKIRQDSMGTESLLLGSSGFLEHLSNKDDYIKSLSYQFEHYRHKWQITPLNAQWWKWKLGRPASFPSLKIAQLAQLLNNTHSIFNLVLDITVLKRALSEISLHPFWENHYHLQKPSVNKSKGLSIEFANKLIANVTVPLMIAYGRHIGDNKLIEQAVEILESLPEEHNNITKAYTEWGLPNHNALHSQAILQLKKEYCDLKRCLSCQIGNQIIRSDTHHVREPQNDFFIEYI